MAFRNPAGHAGLLQTVRSLVASLTLFLESRLRLAAQESRAAVRHLMTLAASLVAAFALLFFGYVFLIIFVVFEVANLLGVSWIWVALGLALLHFLLALACLIFARGLLKRPILRETANVLKEDTEWLKELNRTKRP